MTGKLKVHCRGEGLVSVWAEEGGYKCVRDTLIVENRKLFSIG